MKQIKKEDIEKYIDEYFKKAYRVEHKLQPHFWEAVTKLALDPEAHVDDLLDESAPNCIMDGLRPLSYVYMYKTKERNINSVYDLAKFVADQIIEAESKPLNNVDFFLLEQRIRNLEKAVDSYY